MSPSSGRVDQVSVLKSNIFNSGFSQDKVARYRPSGDQRGDHFPTDPGTGVTLVADKVQNAQVHFLSIPEFPGAKDDLAPVGRPVRIILRFIVFGEKAPRAAALRETI